MANTPSTFEQIQSAQKQMMDSFMDSYQKMVESFMPGETPARNAGEMTMQYFSRMREIMEPMMTTMPENPQALMDHTMAFMKKATDLNMEFSTKYMDMYKGMMDQWPMMTGMGGEKAEPKKPAKKSAAQKS